MNILAVGAHPDDVEILCSGTLLKYAQRGDSVFVMYATDGAAGQVEMTTEEVTALRKEEAKEACKLIGAEMLWAGFPDEMLLDSEASRLKFIELTSLFDRT